MQVEGHADCGTLIRIKIQKFVCVFHVFRNLYLRVPLATSLLPLATPSRRHPGRRQGDLIPRAASLPARQIAAAAAAGTGRGGGGARRLKG